MPVLAQRVAHDWQQLRLPIPDGLVAYLDPTQPQDFAQVTEHQPVVPQADHHEGDDVAGLAGPVQHASTALVELPPAGPAPEPPIALRRDLGPLRCRIRATANAVHAASPNLHLLLRTLRQPFDRCQIARWHER